MRFKFLYFINDIQLTKFMLVFFYNVFIRVGEIGKNENLEIKIEL